QGKALSRSTGGDRQRKLRESQGRSSATIHPAGGALRYGRRRHRGVQRGEVLCPVPKFQQASAGVGAAEPGYLGPSLSLLPFQLLDPLGEYGVGESLRFRQLSPGS